MGGFVDAISDLAGRETSELVSRAGTEAKGWLQKGIGSFENEAKKTQAGTALWDLYNNEYLPSLRRAKQVLLDRYSNFGQTGGQIGPAPSSGMIAKEADNIARKYAYGDHHTRIAAALYWANHETGNFEYVQNLADHVAMVHHGNWTEGTVFGGKVDVDPIKSDVSRISFGRGPDKTINEFALKDLNKSSVYSSHTAVETLANNYTRMFIYPFVALAHLNLPANMLFEPLGEVAKGFKDILPSNLARTEDMARSFGLLAEDTASAMRDSEKFRQGFIANITGKPNLGVIVGKLTHTPGLNFIRHFSICWQAATGKHLAEYYAEDFARTGSKLSRLRLEDMGLNPQRIVEQKGVLTQDDLERAVYHFVDNHMMFVNPGKRSYWSQMNSFTRMATMLHSYVSRQARFFMHEYRLAWKSGNIMQIVKTHAMLAAAFPAVGALTEMMEDYGRGENGFRNLKEKLQNLRRANGPGEAVGAYLDFYSGVGGWGIITSYARGLFRNQISAMAFGPIGNVAFRQISDGFLLGKAYATGASDEVKSSKVKQVGRDILENELNIDNLGRILAHRVLPSKAEQEERAGAQHLKRLKGLKGLKSLKRLE